MPQLVKTVNSLPADVGLIFYCHSGGRSAAAATLATEELAKEMFETAMNLEKRAMRFYTHVGEKHTGEAWADQISIPDPEQVFFALAQAEKGHMLTLIDALTDYPA